jgi:hypothetical protein
MAYQVIWTWKGGACEETKLIVVLANDFKNLTNSPGETHEI